MRLRRLERPLQVVEHRQQLLDQPLVGPRDQACLVTRGPLAVVLEVGLDALEGVDELVALALERLDLVRLRAWSRGNLPVPPDPLHLSAIADGLRLRLVCSDLVAHYDVLASSSSMTS